MPLLQPVTNPEKEEVTIRPKQKVLPVPKRSKTTVETDLRLSLFIAPGNKRRLSLSKPANQSNKHSKGENKHSKGLSNHPKA